jgi:transglutaminase superfamily protein
MEQARKFWRLGLAERRMLIQAGLVVVAVRLALWVLPFGVLRRMLARLPAGSAVTAQNDRLPIERIAWAVMVASSYVPAASCLTQALAAQTLLRRHHYAASLQIGVAKDEQGQLHAHAWLESQGTIVIGGTAEYLASFTPLPPLEN